MAISRREAIGASALAGAALVARPGFAQKVSAKTTGAGKQWWMDEPVRLALLLYNQIDPPLDTDKFVQWLVDMNANAVVLPTGGIGAYYPTKIPFHTIAPSLPPGKDIVGEVVVKSKAQGIRVISRFEWTVNQNPGVVEAHPDWLQRNAAGQVTPWNGTYLMCVNGGYMQDQIFKIMGEVLDKYPIDGMFFNGGGQRIVDGQLCYCDNCKRLYKAKFNADIPAKATPEYTRWMASCSQGLMNKIEAFVRGKRPVNFNYMVGQEGDSRNAETHSQPIVGSRAYWVYQASETVNRYRTDNPEKMSFNNDAAFLDQLWRYAHRSAADGEIRAYQNMANGAGPYIFVIGGTNQTDVNAFRGARPAFKFHKDHEDIYVRQDNAARVLLLDSPPPPPANAGNGGFGYLARDPDGTGGGGRGDANTSMRGWFRLLSELHIPFALTNDLSWVDKDPGRYDLVVTGRGAPAALDKYLRGGGRVLASGTLKPELDIPPVVKTWERKDLSSAYWRVRDKALFPSLDGTTHLLMYGDYLELEARGNAALTLIPPSLTNPMEKVGTDRVDTTKPGIHLADYGSGKLVYLPWDFGDLYYRFASVTHSAMASDLVDHLLPKGRQIMTNAHPTVQITVHKQKAMGRTNVHFVNLSGESQTAYHPAVPMSGIQVEVAGNFSNARMASMGRDLPIRKIGGYTSFTLPNLDTYDVVVLT